MRGSDLQQNQAEAPSVVLRRLAEHEAERLGHALGPWNEAVDCGQFFARCEQCWRGVSVQPHRFAQDKRGRGGRGLRERCA